MSEECWVELDDFGPCRIFASRTEALLSEAAARGLVGCCEYMAACSVIRRRVFVRDAWACNHCGAPVTWDTGHMHEREWRGRGGEISLENSVTLCYNCHMDDPVAGHGERSIKWTSKPM